MHQLTCRSLITLISGKCSYLRDGYQNDHAVTELGCKVIDDREICIWRHVRYAALEQPQANIDLDRVSIWESTIDARRQIQVESLDDVRQKVVSADYFVRRVWRWQLVYCDSGKNVVHEEADGDLRIGNRSELMAVSVGRFKACTLCFASATSDVTMSRSVASILASDLLRLRSEEPKSAFAHFVCMTRIMDCKHVDLPSPLGLWWSSSSALRASCTSRLRKIIRLVPSI